MHAYMHTHACARLLHLLGARRLVEAPLFTTSWSCAAFHPSVATHSSVKWKVAGLSMAVTRHSCILRRDILVARGRA